MTDRQALRLRIRGLVQGVGFRPAVYRLATSLQLHGWVRNDGVGVRVHLEGAAIALDQFRQQLNAALPEAARIEAIAEEPAEIEGTTSFRVVLEDRTAETPLQARVPIDRAVCRQCRAEILDASNRRHRHAFASCVDCGPRFSILRALPYERHNTSMAAFPMCRTCGAEYENPDDRRFHAEPIACPTCGPCLSGTFDGDAIRVAAAALHAGQIVALKGLGGYQLLVRADDEDAVMRLRQRKGRPSKPFAVMVASLEQADRIACITPIERSLLGSAENPIVLVDAKHEVADAVAPHLTQIGVFLPTTPLHVLLLSEVDFPVVATSGNRSEEPIAIDEAGRDGLANIADVVLDHDRPIVRRVDDSVVRVIDGRPMVLRLARGLGPCSLSALEKWAADAGMNIPAILAVGAQQKGALALWSGTQAILGPHLGDLDDAETRRVFTAATRDVPELCRCQPAMLACDLHPDYFTSQWTAAAGLPFCSVQHHHAHAVACMVEHDLFDRQVLAVTFDGTGYGPDDTIWGGEILQVSLENFERIASLDPFALPGGEAAIRAPARIALSLLVQTFGPTAIPRWLVDRLCIQDNQARVLMRMIEYGIHSPRTSSVGRLFDAIAALVLNAHTVTYEGEAAVWLESVVAPNEETAYPIDVRCDERGVRRADWRPLVRSLVADIAAGVAAGVCAARFHNAVAQWTAAIAMTSPLQDVVLGGGCFQNAYLTRRVRMALEAIGKTVHVPSRIPCNDGGLAVGQLAVAMGRWRSQQAENHSCVSESRAESSNERP